MTTINYDLPVKDLIAGLDATGHVTHTSYKKTSVTIHHNGGRLSHEGVLEVWKTRPASAHFDADSKGAIAQYVRVHEYAWATGNTTGNIGSVSVEMCDLTLAPDWVVAEGTWKAAARLAGWLFVHVIEGAPRPSSANLHYHHFWKSTDCAGPYMDKVYSQLLAETQRWYDHFKSPAAPAPKDWFDMATEAQLYAQSYKADYQYGVDFWVHGTGAALIRQVNAIAAATIANGNAIAALAAEDVADDNEFRAAVAEIKAADTAIAASLEALTAQAAPKA